MATTVTVSRTNNADIDGLLSGYKWSGAITYSFPDSSSDYANPYSGGSSEPTTSGFASAPTQMQAAINYAIGLILSYTNASILYNGTNGADIMIAQSPSANPTSYAYYPGNYAAGGDVWFGTAYNYSLAALGNYYFTTALHELGHALGLKHSQETGGVANVAVPTVHDDSEYTVMSYRSYVGGPLTGYTNEAYGYPQTYMANDILALQTLYGANYTTQSGTTVYTWSTTTGQEFINGVGQPADNGGAGGSANRIFETVWDGGGVDTYDLSNYTTNLSINLNPGASSAFSSVQLANLGNGHYAAGNVYNAYLYNNDARSYIDNAIGGSGNDTVVGNAIANTLNGGTGNDTITGGGGNDTIIGGSGTDTAVYSGSRASYAVTYGASAQTFALSDQRSGSPDGTDTLSGVENFQFADGTVSNTTLISQLAPVVIETFGTTNLVQQGGNYFLDPVAGGSGPELKYAGLIVTAGQFGGAWAPIGTEAIGAGYNVVWKDSATNQYSVWTTDSNGTYVSDIGLVAANNAALEQLETIFHQDLNGDGTIGPITANIETLGVTSLVRVGGNYFLDPVAGGSGPELKYAGLIVTAGQFGGAWAPIGTEAIGVGYDVVWKDSATNQYSVWTTDSNGTYVSDIGLVAASNVALEQLETIFHQDLNGDGTIGPITANIETLGVTSLVRVGGNYFLDPVAGGSGPELKYAGLIVTAGQFGGAWAPIGTEAISASYNVVWKDSATNQYSVWTTDSNGTYVSDIGLVAANNAALEQLETIFHQDLNGDGTIGLVGTTIEALGATSLVQVGSNYYLEPVGSNSGSVLKFGGAAVTAGQFGSYWTILGAEAVSGGYDVAWKNSATGLYNIWSSDSSGNYVTDLLSSASPNSGSLESFETIFHQDLNGDGTIGSTSASSAVAAPDGAPVAPPQWLDQHFRNDFHFVDDPNAGALAATQPSQSASLPFIRVAHDNFVFTPTLDQSSLYLAGSKHARQFDKGADLGSVLTIIHDDTSGEAVIDIPGDATILQHFAIAQLLAHQGNFHLV
ncbi:M10 family metallopeptidase C-terminal domain-containing protein [Bradyrhizobium barranii]|uniref:M10 family metallopeptidase C-terminal domain-containing protein n=1 Tax=Bradyrhizobium barranii TaxID=2992140 RepID=UPI0024AFE80B|nr:M10 family metallopeptidase C-terminal domain-containing protein [Bradyrhizobium barranii]WFT92862.1 M10 family metallopeptidase C-terminal domain-containing protein [Bradyrhizobium barranii]